jgi:hypothetical protein
VVKSQTLMENRQAAAALHYMHYKDASGDSRNGSWAGWPCLVY